ncbi:MAG: biotin transporter BioY [Maritimibacter sp.]
MTPMTNNVLGDMFGAHEGARLRAKQIALVIVGVAVLALASKIRVPAWPVPITLQTLAVLTIGTAYGARLGLVTLLAWVALGAAGLAVFAGDKAGLAYIAGPTGGYLVGFVVAAAAMGAMARKGMDRTVLGMAGAMLIGTAIIYAFGLMGMSFIFLAENGAAWVIKFGFTNFIVGDIVKMVIAAMIIPGVWKLVGNARS